MIINSYFLLKYFITVSNLCPEYTVLYLKCQLAFKKLQGFNFGPSIQVLQRIVSGIECLEIRKDYDSLKNEFKKRIINIE